MELTTQQEGMALPDEEEQGELSDAEKKRIYAKKLLGTGMSHRNVNLKIKQQYGSGISTHILTDLRAEIINESNGTTAESAVIFNLKDKVLKLLDIGKNQKEELARQEAVIRQLLELFMAFNLELRESGDISIKVFKTLVKSKLDLPVIDEYITKLGVKKL